MASVAQPGFGGGEHRGSGERKSPSGVQGQSPWWVVRRGGHSLPKAHSSGCQTMHIFVYLCTNRVVRGRGSMKGLSVRLSVPSIGNSSGVWRVCCWAPRRQVISIYSRRRRSVANVGSVLLVTKQVYAVSLLRRLST